MQSIVFVPSYILNNTKNFPLFNSLIFIPKFISSSLGSNSTFSNLPSIITFPLSTPISWILVIGALKFRLLPYIKGVSSSSCGAVGASGIGGIGISGAGAELLFCLFCLFWLFWYCLFAYCFLPAYWLFPALLPLSYFLVSAFGLLSVEADSCVIWSITSFSSFSIFSLYWETAFSDTFSLYSITYFFP